MKKILLIAAGMTIYSFVFAQEMKGMNMPKKEQPKRTAIKKKPKSIAKPSAV